MLPLHPSPSTEVSGYVSLDFIIEFMTSLSHLGLEVKLMKITEMERKEGISSFMTMHSFSGHWILFLFCH